MGERTPTRAETLSASDPPLFNPIRLLWSASARDELPFPVYLRIRRRIGQMSGRRDLSWAAFATVSLSLGGLGVLFAYNGYGSRFSYALFLGFAVWFGVQIPLALLRLPWRVDRRIIAAAFLAERRCPHCIYDLCGESLGEDARCPECGTCWRVVFADSAPKPK